jgi:NAD(P)-dependent dehydrogenase (short-subunit alcohol dehydrogenase family)
LHSSNPGRNQQVKRTALVIGGGRGIGRATAVELARRGYDLIVAARHPEEIVATAKEIAGLHVRALAVTADVTQDESILKLCSQVSAFSDKLDMLVNSAGTAFLGQLQSTTPEIFDAQLQVNLVGPYRCIYHATELLKRARGQVVNVASRAARIPYANASAYGSAKAALVYLTRSLSQELAEYGVRINAISPGAVATALRREVFPDEDRTRLMHAAAVAEIIGQMTEGAFSTMTGAVIDVPW